MLDVEELSIGFTWKFSRFEKVSNISFLDLCNLVKSLGFEVRIRGDHHIFSMDNVEEILNLQPKGSKAKAYQVKQVRNLILKYHLGEEHDAQI